MAIDGGASGTTCAAIVASTANIGVGAASYLQKVGPGGWNVIMGAIGLVGTLGIKWYFDARRDRREAESQRNKEAQMKALNEAQIEEIKSHMGG